MDVLGTLPVWVQLLIVFLVAGVLVVMNVGWLVQAREWLKRPKQQRPSGPARTGPTPGDTSPGGTSPTARSEGDDA
jgi:hypothetical protein